MGHLNACCMKTITKFNYRTNTAGPRGDLKRPYITYLVNYIGETLIPARSKVTLRGFWLHEGGGESGEFEFTLPLPAHLSFDLPIFHLPPFRVCRLRNVTLFFVARLPAND